MKPVTFPLKLQMKRAEVGDLHQALSALGFSIAGTGKKNQRFGISTRKDEKGTGYFNLARRTRGRNVDSSPSTVASFCCHSGKPKRSGVIPRTDTEVLPLATRRS